LTKLGEIDDGLFDWMIVLDTKKKQKDQMREAEKVNRAKQEAIEIDIPQSNLASPIGRVISPSSNLAVYSSPSRADPLEDKRNSRLKPTEQVPQTGAEITPNLRPQEQQQPIAPVKKKSWWKKLFSCGQSKYD
jgi:hypothetical protein